MSLHQNIEHLATAPGIAAVLIDNGQQQAATRGTERWADVLRSCLSLFRLTDETSLRLVIAKHTVVVQKEGSEVAVVALETGHPTAKSLRRMIRRTAKRRATTARPPSERESVATAQV